MEKLIKKIENLSESEFDEIGRLLVDAGVPENGLAEQLVQLITDTELEETPPAKAYIKIMHFYIKEQNRRHQIFHKKIWPD